VASKRWRKNVSLYWNTQALGDRTPEQWQQDAFGQIDALLRAMALRT
jgi:hypothetical protein